MTHFRFFFLILLAVCLCACSDQEESVENHLAELCDITVAVTAPAEIRVQRLMQRDGITESYARSRIAAQHPEDWFRQRCSYTLENSGTEIQFHKNCLAFLQELGII